MLNVGDKNGNGPISYMGIKKQDQQGGVRGAGLVRSLRGEGVCLKTWEPSDSLRREPTATVALTPCVLCCTYLFMDT